MAPSDLRNGMTSGIGSLPHRDGEHAARFVLDTMGLPAIPTLPRRSPAEGMIAQAVVGLEGITLGQYGAIAVDVNRIDPVNPVTTDLSHDAFGGFRSFLALAPGRVRRVKWQFVGPVTLGLALQRAGVPAPMAFDAALTAVRSHVGALHHHIAAALPDAQQLVVLDEPSFPEVMEPDFVIPLDHAIDLVSSALAMVEQTAVTGIHCCGAADWASLIAAGPKVLSVPVHDDLAKVSGYLGRFLADGGWIIWGAVPTDGPIPHTAERPWRVLTKLWCDLVNGGCDPILLRTQSLISPACGLGLHSDAVARRVFRIVGELAHRVHSQAVATRLSIGA